MSSFDLVINGKTVKANYGETLIDAGLSGWVAIPHDCCSGQCETCRVTVVSGRVDDRGTAEKGTVLACQAKVIADAAIAFDHVPAIAKRSGLITAIATLAPDIVEVVVTLATPIDFRPGQYLSVRYSERLADNDIVASVGSKGDSFDNAMAESFNGLFKWELIYRHGPWRGLDDVEFATMTYVDWFNHRRLFEAHGHIPPAEFEANHNRQNGSGQQAETQTKQPA